jgi:hypothetical protein
MSQAGFLSVVIGVMIVAGFLGGLVNYFLTRKDDPEGSSFWKSATLGIAASLLVPLFLNMISSNLLESIRNGTPSPDLSRILVFLGFCLVAAISSTSFIRTLSDRILQEAKEAKKAARQADKKASEVQSAIQPIVEKETEVEEPSSGTAASLSSPPAIVDEKEKKLLQNLANGKWVLRTRTGLAKETGIPKPEVDGMMDDLRKRKLVDYKWIVGRGEEKKKRWYITNEGRAAIA